MDNELKRIAIDSKLDVLYRNNLFSIKSICEHLGIWSDYSTDEKIKLENLTSRDSRLNKNFTFNGKYDESLVYGEVTRKGVDTIIEKIIKHKKDFQKTDIFVDVGSGCGKLTLHSAMKLPIQTFVGLEIVKERYLYSKKISEEVLPIDDKKIFFINKDFQNFDLSIAKVVFCNNLCFSHELNKSLTESLSTGTHIIVSKPLDIKICKEVFTVEVSWIKDPFVFRYYIK